MSVRPRFTYAVLSHLRLLGVFAVALLLLSAGLAAPAATRAGSSLPRNTQPAAALDADSSDLTGLWKDDTNSGAIYRFRQIGSQFYWAVDAMANNGVFNIYVGKIDGSTITGGWLDVPGSSVFFGGSMSLRIDTPNHLVKVPGSEAPCCYGGQEWFRQSSGSGGPTPPTPTPTSTTGSTSGQSIDWNSRPAQDHRNDVGQRYTYTCPPNGSIQSVWGTDVYTDDSALCTAAVHAGLITVANGGTVTIEIAGSQSSFTGSNRNGVSTSNYGGWPGSYRFVR